MMNGVLISSKSDGMGALLLILILGVYFALRLFGIAEIYEVKTGSMEEKIHVGDYIMIYRKNDSL